MKRIALIILTAIAAISFAGCPAPPAANNATVANTNTNANAAKPAAPATKEALVALETKAFEAWKNKDGKFFEGFLTDNFVMFGEKGRIDKAATVKEISENKCVINSYSFSDEQVTPIGADAALITMKVTADYTCEGQKGPSPVWSASVYVRSGDQWKGAYHNEVPVTYPKAAKTGPPKPPPPAKPAAAEEKPADALTEALMAVEKKGWAGWQNKDAKALDETLAKDLVFIGPDGDKRVDKAGAIKMWATENKCDVKSFSLTDAQGKTLTKDAAIMTFKGNADGSCEGDPLKPVWATTVYVKEGENWKAVLIFETYA